MASLSPTEARAANPIWQGSLSWWHIRPPQDESTPPRWARTITDRQAHYVLPTCLVILAARASSCAFAWCRTLVLCLCGLLDTRMMLKGPRGDGRRNAHLVARFFSVPGTVFVATFVGATHSSRYASTMLYATACAAGSCAFFCWRFRELFLRSTENPAKSVSSEPLSLQSVGSAYAPTVAARTFVY